MVAGIGDHHRCSDNNPLQYMIHLFDIVSLKWSWHSCTHNDYVGPYFFVKIIYYSEEAAWSKGLPLRPSFKKLDWTWKSRTKTMNRALIGRLLDSAGAKQNMCRVQQPANHSFVHASRFLVSFQFVKNTAWDDFFHVVKNTHGKAREVELCDWSKRSMIRKETKRPGKGPITELLHISSDGQFYSSPQ